MRLVGGFDAVGGTGRLGKERGTVGAILILELPGETFYGGKLTVGVPLIVDAVFEPGGVARSADKVDAFVLAGAV